MTVISNKGLIMTVFLLILSAKPETTGILGRWETDSPGLLLEHCHLGY